VRPAHSARSHAPARQERELRALAHVTPAIGFAGPRPDGRGGLDIGTGE